MKEEKLIETTVLKKVILALQHLIAMFGATVLVPYLTGMSPSIALFTAGVGTLIFHFCTKGKIPVFLGSSFAFIPAIITVTEMYGGDIAYAQGGVFVAGLAYVILALLVNIIGVEKIQKILAPHVVGPMIMVIGLNLLPTAIGMTSEHFLLGLVTLSIALLITLFTRGFIKQLAIIIAVVSGYILALILGEVNIELLRASNLVVIPNFVTPKFDIGAILVTVPVVLALFMEHIGDITTISAVTGEDFIKEPGLNRSLLGDGLASMFAALVGGPPNTTYSENTGVIVLTKNYDPSIIRLAAIFAIILSFIGTVGALLSSIPTAVMGGISIMLFNMIAFIGFKTIKDNKVEMNLKNIIVMSTILIIGLGSNFGLNLTINLTETVSFSGLSLAALVGVILNLVLEKIIK